jgi:predicted ABC-type sugar transport system permease subunit
VCLIRQRFARRRVIVPAIVAAAAMFALACGLERLYDGRGLLTPVLAGMTMGVMAALLIAWESPGQDQ